MKLFAVADVHGKANCLDRIEAIVRRQTPDCIVIAGDLINYFNPRPTLARLSALGLPVYYVRGNSDPARLNNIAKQYPHLRNLHLNIRHIGSLPMVGIDGTLPLPFHSKAGLREKAALAALAPMIDASTCLVVHPPPHGTKDKVAGRFHAGSRRLAGFVKERKPQAVICGHIHEDPGEMVWGAQTRIINCSVGKSGNGAVIEIDGNGRIERVAWP